MRGVRGSRGWGGEVDAGLTDDTVCSWSLQEEKEEEKEVEKEG